MHVTRLIAWILVLAAGAGALVYGALYHQVPVEVEKHREITIAVPTMQAPGEMPFAPPGFGGPGVMPPGFPGPPGMQPGFGGPEGMAPGFGGSEGTPPGDSPMPAAPPPMVPGIKMETVTEKYVESQEDPEWVIVFDTTIGGVARLANGQLKRTYSGKPPALCPT